MEIKILNVTYGLFKNLNITILEGVTGVTGKPASGKTLFLHILAGLIKPNSGKVELMGASTPITGITFEVPEENILLPTVYDEVAFGIKNYKRDVNLIEKTIKFFDLDKSKKTEQLSYTEKKLLSLASLSYSPEIIFLDDPLRGLYSEYRDKVAQFLSQLVKTAKITVITGLIESLPMDICNRIIYLEQGKVKFYGDTKTFKRKLQYLKQ